MLPGTGYFKTIPCPFYETGFCERPYCHFRHVAKDSRNEPNVPAVVAAASVLPATAAAGSSTAGSNAAATAPAMPTSVTSSAVEAVASAASSLLDKQSLENMVQEAVKKILLGGGGEKPKLLENIDTAAIVKQIKTEAEEEEDDIIIECEIPPPTSAVKQEDGVELPKPKLYLPPPNLPVYNPTPIKELEKRKSQEETPTAKEKPNYQIPSVLMAATSILHPTSTVVPLAKGKSGKKTFSYIPAAAPPAADQVFGETGDLSDSDDNFETPDVLGSILKEGNKTGVLTGGISSAFEEEVIKEKWKLLKKKKEAATKEGGVGDSSDEKTGAAGCKEGAGDATCGDKTDEQCDLITSSNTELEKEPGEKQAESKPAAPKDETPEEREERKIREEEEAIRKLEEKRKILENFYKSKMAAKGKAGLTAVQSAEKSSTSRHKEDRKKGDKHKKASKTQEQSSDSQSKKDHHHRHHGHSRSSGSKSSSRKHKKKSSHHRSHSDRKKSKKRRKSSSSSSGTESGTNTSDDDDDLSTTSADGQSESGSSARGNTKSRGHHRSSRRKRKSAKRKKRRHNKNSPMSSTSEEEVDSDEPESNVETKERRGMEGEVAGKGDTPNAVGEGGGEGGDVEEEYLERPGGRPEKDLLSNPKQETGELDFKTTEAQIRELLEKKRAEQSPLKSKLEPKMEVGSKLEPDPKLEPVGDLKAEPSFAKQQLKEPENTVIKVKNLSELIAGGSGTDLIAGGSGTELMAGNSGTVFAGSMVVDSTNIFGGEESFHDMIEKYRSSWGGMNPDGGDDAADIVIKPSAVKLEFPLDIADIAEEEEEEREVKKEEEKGKEEEEEDGVNTSGGKSFLDMMAEMDKLPEKRKKPEKERERRKDGDHKGRSSHSSSSRSGGHKGEKKKKEKGDKEERRRESKEGKEGRKDRKEDGHSRKRSRERSSSHRRDEDRHSSSHQKHKKHRHRSPSEREKKSSTSERDKKTRTNSGGASRDKRTSSGVSTSPLPDFADELALLPDDFNDDVSDNMDIDAGMESIFGGIEDGDDDELQRVFNQFSAENSEPTTNPTEGKKRKAEERKNPENSLGKKRVAYSGALDTGKRSLTQKKPQVKTPAQAMLDRYKKLQNMRQQQLIEKRMGEITEEPTEPTPGPSTAAPVSGGEAVAVFKPGKSRVAHSSAAGPPPALSKAKQQLAARSGATSAHTQSKGAARVAHVPTNAAVLKPTVTPDPHSKVPINVRQRYLDSIVEECLKIYAGDELEAYPRSEREEADCCRKASSRMIYLNLAVNCIKRLRGEAAEAAKAAPAAAAAASTSGTQTKKKNLLTTHMQVLAGRPGSIGTWSIEKQVRLTDDDIDGEMLYCVMRSYVLTEEQLVDNGFPRPDPQEKGKAVVKIDPSRQVKQPTEPDMRKCDRCKSIYRVDKFGIQIEREDCVHHWGRLFRKRGNRAIGGQQSVYYCCQQGVDSDGCQVSKVHVTDVLDYNNMRGFVSTLDRPGEGRVFALDCEMCNTTQGNELTRVTVVDNTGAVCYETMVLPENDIIDYNTRFSGLKAEDLVGVRTRLRDVQAVLLLKFKSSDILIGHSLESDLKVLKLLHNTIVDTSVVFPHKMGPPFKRALKFLAADHLKRIIQNDESGHDSKEDALACLDLMKMKVREDVKKLQKKARIQAMHNQN